MIIQERYAATLMGVNATARINASQVGGFLCKTTGTLTITNDNGVIVVDAHPVTAGVYHPMPFLLGTIGGTAVAAGGASGTLATA